MRRERERNGREEKNPVQVDCKCGQEHNKLADFFYSLYHCQ
jgi:hypothetical protein